MYSQVQLDGETLNVHGSRCDRGACKLMSFGNELARRVL